MSTTDHANSGRWNIRQPGIQLIRALHALASPGEPADTLAAISGEKLTRSDR
jgi:hypothetical protein